MERKQTKMIETQPCMVSFHMRETEEEEHSKEEEEKGGGGQVFSKCVAF